MPTEQPKSSSTNPIPLNTQQVEELRQWMRKHYALAFDPPESIDGCKDSHKLAFNAGILGVYRDLKHISDKDNKPR